MDNKKKKSEESELESDIPSSDSDREMKGIEEQPEVSKTNQKKQKEEKQPEEELNSSNKGNQEEQKKEEENKKAKDEDKAEEGNEEEQRKEEEVQKEKANLPAGEGNNVANTQTLLVAKESSLDLNDKKEPVLREESKDLLEEDDIFIEKLQTKTKILRTIEKDTEMTLMFKNSSTTDEARVLGEFDNQSEDQVSKIYQEALKEHLVREDEDGCKKHSCCKFHTGWYFCCGFNQTVNSEQMGLGVTVYFKLMKTFWVFLLLLGIVQIPIIAAFIGGSVHKEGGSLQYYLAQTTIGNISASF